MTFRRRKWFYLLSILSFLASFNLIWQLIYSNRNWKSGSGVPISGDPDETQVLLDRLEEDWSVVLPVNKVENAENIEDFENFEVPVQNNPWIELNNKSSLQNGNKFKEVKVGNCVYKRFSNHSVYSKPDFMEEYSDFRKCIGSISDWNEKMILAKTGQKGQLVLRTKFEYSVTPPGCPDTDPPEMLYVAFSDSISGFSERNAIRKTWGSDLNGKYRLIFVLPYGKSEKLQQEIKFHHDILQTDISQDDPDFANRQFASVLSWIYQHCELSRFVAKITDKTFVNAKRFSLLIEQEMYSANRLYGELLTRMEPNRDPKSEHYVTETEWPWPYFPPFLNGPSFIISGDVIPRLLTAARYTPVLTLPQVYFTGLVPLTNRMMRIGVAEFFQKDVPEFEDECTYAKHGTIENVSGFEEMNRIFRQVQEVQDVRNVTCTIKPPCLAKIDGKCMLYSPKMKTKTKVNKNKN